MSFAESSLRSQQWVVAAMLGTSALLVLPAAVEPFMLPKATLVVALGVVLFALAVARAAWTRRIALPSAPATWTVGAFTGALVLTTLTSSEPWASTIGFYGRYTGLVPYLCYIGVFFFALGAASDGFCRLLRRVAVPVLAVVVGYGLLQALGLEFVDYNFETGLRNFSTFGNVNFAAAWPAMVSPLLVVTAADRSEPPAWRWAAGLLLPLTLVYVVVAGASQGPIVAAVSLSFAGLLLATGPEGAARSVAARGRRVAFGAAALAIACVVALAAAAPWLRGQLAESLEERVQLWEAALRIFADYPVLGTGLDTYAHYFLAYRPVQHALDRGVGTSDAPHSVVLGMFSNGGVVLGVSYLAVLLTVGVALIRGLRRLAGAERLALAGFGGLWLGYQAQSLVSFDVPPLALLHWLSAGIVVALAAPPTWRRVELPGRAAARPARRSGKAYGDIAVPTWTRAIQALTAVVALAMIWFSLYPLRADLVAASAAPLASSGRFDETIDRFERAADLNPAEASYPFLAARGHAAAGRHAEAVAAAAEAARRDPGTVQYALFAGREAEAAGDVEAAGRWYAEAAVRDPLDPPVLVEVAGYFLRTGELQEAERLALRAVDVRPDGSSLVVLARARMARDDLTGARAALRQALDVEPEDEEVRRLAAELSVAPA